MLSCSAAHAVHIVANPEGLELLLLASQRCQPVRMFFLLFGQRSAWTLPP